MTRNLEELHWDQEAILNAYREERTRDLPIEKHIGGGFVSGGYAIGRVDEIIVSDSVYGSHLLVVRQSWSGIPPVPVDSAVGPIRCYFVPGRAVSDFSEDDLVRMIYVNGAILVEPLG